MRKSFRCRCRGRCHGAALRSGRNRGGVGGGDQAVSYPRILTEPGGGTATLERPSTGDSSATDGWFTIKGRVESCPCGHSSPYTCEASRPHRVVVWPSADDPTLVKALSSIR